MNWGYKIALLYIAFAAMILLLVTLSVKQKIDLVSKDYYAQELIFQDRIESTERMLLLDTPVEIHSDEKGITINYPDAFKGNTLAGTITLFRPSDKELDLIIPVQPNDVNGQFISNSILKAGMYRVKLELALNGKNYYKEQMVIIE